MGRTVAVIWHASFSLAAGVLYFFFVLPRTPELLGQTSTTLGTAMRIVTGALIGLAALPVVFTLLRTRKPELGTPAMALNLRTSSIVLQVLAGVLIIGAAISEIWLSLNTAGQWLFGIYGAAAAIAVLGMFAFYLAFVAELPPPPPKPLKVKKRAASNDEADEADTQADDTDEAGEASGAEAPADNEPIVTSESKADEEASADPDTERDADDTTTPGAPGDKLQNRRPTGKTTLLGRRKKSRGGVALED